jgi:hypothetical protein
LVRIAEAKSTPYWLRQAWQSLRPAILAIAYHFPVQRGQSAAGGLNAASPCPTAANSFRKIAGRRSNSACEGSLGGDLWSLWRAARRLRYRVGGAPGE